MGLFSKFTKTGRVYAGPEAIGKKAGYDMGDVYAGPEQMGVPDASEGMGEQQPYPLNNAVMPDSDYAAQAEVIDCPMCGEKTRHGKFCECCGFVFK